MINHEVILNWSPNTRTVTVIHINEPKKGEANIGDTITFEAKPARDASVAITFNKGSNFSNGQSFVITDSTPHDVILLGDFDFQCAVIENNTTRHDQTPGDSTKHPRS